MLRVSPLRFVPSLAHTQDVLPYSSQVASGDVFEKAGILYYTLQNKRCQKKGPAACPWLSQETKLNCSHLSIGICLSPLFSLFVCAFFSLSSKWGLKIEKDENKLGDERH